MPAFVPNPVVITAPASTSNIGPGFDCLGLALSMADTVTAAVTSGGLNVEVMGEGASDLPRDERHLVVRAARAAFDELGGQPAGLAFGFQNDIPQSRGLGSSAAAIVAGIVAARALTVDGDQLMNDAKVVELASRIEGHPDQVAACLWGGLTIAWTEADEVRAEPSWVLDEVTAVAYIPAERSSTSEARALLPKTVPHASAAANSGRAALLVHALSNDPRLLLPATRDWLHQDARADAMPESAALIEKLRSAGIPAVLSGAGPTVLALAAPSLPQAPTTAPGFAVRELSVDRSGATVTRR